MAAGLGFKTFTTGEVLTAADTNGYLMQGINVFASTAARDAAITSPQEGQFAFTKDTNGLWYYDGAAWVASGATGDIEGVTAGVGITGGGTSGTVTITNDMATTITAAGDIVVGTGSGTYDNLPIGTTAQVLTCDTTVSPYKVKWATPASGGGMTLLSTTTLSGATVTVTVAGGYKSIIAVCLNMTNATADGKFRCAPNGTFNANYVITKSALGTVTTYADVTDYIQVSGYVDMARANTNNAFTLKIDNYDLATSGTVRAFNIYGGCINTAGTQSSINVGGAWGSGYGTAITSLVFSNSGGNLSAGTVLLYGVN